MAMNRPITEKLANAVIVLFMIVLMIITFYPLLYTVFASFSDAKGMLRHLGPLWWPLQPTTLQGYKLVLKNPNIVTGFRNSTLYLFSGTLLSLVLTGMGAFVVTRKHFVLRNIMMKFILVTMYINGGIIALFFVVKNIGIYDTPLAMIMPWAVNSFYLIIMRTFFANIPDSMEESAILDGANDFQVLWRIFVPLSTPVIAVVAMQYGVGLWNAYYQALVFMRNRTIFPLQMFLREILILSQITDQPDAAAQAAESYTRELVKYCTVVVATVPILVIYPFLQRYFVHGVMIGAIKG